MTVIAGASLFNGVILLADTRATIKRPGKADIRCDIAQKLFPLTPTTAIGFCGDIRTASILLHNAMRQLRSRPHNDAVSLASWLPRFLRASYRALAKRNRARPVSFMVGSVIGDRPNVIERSKVVELFKTIGYGKSPIKRTFVPDIVMQFMLRPSHHKHIAIRGSVRGLLYTLHHPDFVPRHRQPLDYCAIGTGGGSIHEITAIADWLLAGMPGNDMVEGLALSEAVLSFIAAEGIDDVGGMYPCLKLDHRGVRCLGHGMGFPGDRVSVFFDPAIRRWVQENEATGKRIPLLLPWEIDPHSMSADRRFDDWVDAVRAFNPRRLQRRP